MKQSERHSHVDGKWLTNQSLDLSDINIMPIDKQAKNCVEWEKIISQFLKKIF